MIKGLLLDYGGTIDTNGLHWAVVIQSSYIKQGIELPEETFKKAYSYGERMLAIQPLVKPTHNFLDVLRLKTEQQFIFLKDNGFDLGHEKIETIALECNRFAENAIAAAIPVLEQLETMVPMVIVSNFYGNLDAVLEHFKIRHFFKDVVESAVAGVRKPDPAIYQLGVDALELPAADCLVVGDSFAKDIVTAKKIGCKAAWLFAKGWEEDAPTGDVAADYSISSFEEVVGLVKSESH